MMSCGGWNRTSDLQIMSLMSYLFSTPRYCVLSQNKYVITQAYPKPPPNITLTLYLFCTCLLFSQYWLPRPVHFPVTPVLETGVLIIIHHRAVVGRGIEPLGILYHCSSRTITTYY